MILVTFAVPFESAAFRRRAVSRGVTIVHTGVGVDAARVALEAALCGEEPPERVISSGFAGALAPGLAVGEVVRDGEGRTGREVIFGTAETVLASAAEKAEFRARTAADVVDMETSAIRDVCAVAGVRLTVLRAISDGAEDDLALPPALLEALAARPIRSFPRLAWTLARERDRRRAFLRFLRDCRRAQHALADALESELGG